MLGLMEQPNAPAPQQPANEPASTGGKVVAIALVALLAVCFVGSCSVAAVSLIGKVADETKTASLDTTWKKPKVKSPLAVPPKKPKSPKAPEPDEDVPTDPLAVISPPDDDLPTTPEPAEAPFVPLDQASAEFALFFPVKAKTDAFKALQKAAKSRNLPVYLEEPEDPPSAYLTIRTVDTEEYAPIGGEVLELAHGLSQKEQEAVADSQSVAIIDLVLPLKSTAKLQDVSKLMLELQKATGGTLWDEDSQEYFSPAEWKKRRVDGWEKGIPDGLFHFTVYVTPKGTGHELQTGGLSHFALPELRLSGVPGSSKDAATRLLNLVAQQMIEGTFAAEPGERTLRIADVKHKARRELLQKSLTEGAPGQTEVTLTSVGTIATPTLELTFPGSGTTATRLNGALAGLFGSTDRVDDIAHDAELLALSKKQMQLFGGIIKKRFQKGLLPGEKLLVKAPFPADSGGNEWMWVEVSKIKPDGTIIGTLSNDPNDVSDLMSGDEVVVVEAELFDWILKEKNGKELGNETGKVMLKRLGR